MKLVALAMVKNEEYWVWYALTSVAPHVDEILLYDNHSTDRTLEVVHGMEHLAGKLTVFGRFGGDSEQRNREEMLLEARRRGATHVLFVDGDEVHSDATLGFCRRLLEMHEHTPALSDPPRNHMRPLDHTPTDGILIKNIGMKPICPAFGGLDSCRPQDRIEPDTNHGCYNFAIRIAALQNLRGNGQEWGLHGYLETGDLYIQSSPHTLWLPGAYYLHFAYHPRSSRRTAEGDGYGKPVFDFGGVPIHEHVQAPGVLFRSDGPSNPTLEAWGLRRAPKRTGPAPWISCSAR